MSSPASNSSIVLEAPDNVHNDGDFKEYFDPYVTNAEDPSTFVSPMRQMGAESYPQRRPKWPAQMSTDYAQREDISL